LGKGGSGMTGEPREHSFDELTRGMASGSISRGRALRLMGAALLGSTLGSLGIVDEASADPPGCKRNGKNCTRNDQCCSGNCAGGTCSACPAGRVELSNGTCALISAVPCNCPAGCACFPERDPAGSRELCTSNLTFTRCPNGHSDCPEGQFCGGSFHEPRCVVAC
jgi:hypothetical protein